MQCFQSNIHQMVILYRSIFMLVHQNKERRAVHIINDTTNIRRSKISKNYIIYNEKQKHVSLLSFPLFLFQNQTDYLLLYVHPLLNEIHIDISMFD